MATVTRTKRELKAQLVEEAVRENVDTMRQVWRHRPRTVLVELEAERRPWLWVLAVLPLPLAVLGSFLFLRGTVPAQGDVASVAPQVNAAGVVPGANPAATADGVKPTVESLDRMDIDAAMFPLGVRTIVVDPGHGGSNRGTRASGGLIEKEITLDIGRRLKGLLEEGGYRVVMTRGRDTSVSLQDRARIANEAQGDIFISIHVNWIENRGTRGVETYYLGPTDDPYLRELASSENREAGYTLAAFRGMLEKVYANVRTDESKRLATEVQRSLYSSLGKVNPTLRNRGVKSAPFVVLTGTEMPAVLAEVSCLSNDQEARLLKEYAYRQYIAEALYRGLDAFAANRVQLASVGS